MKGRDYLMRAWQADAQVARKMEELERLNGQLSALKTSLDQKDDWHEVEVAIAAVGEVISREILALCRAKREVIAAIEAVEDERLRRLLELRYRSYLTWEAIADEMGYEVRHVYRMHREALRRVEQRWAAQLEQAV